MKIMLHKNKKKKERITHRILILVYLNIQDFIGIEMVVFAAFCWL